MLERLRHATPHLLMLAITGGLYRAATLIDGSGAAGRIGPDFWPKLIVSAMALLCLYEACKRLINGPAARAAQTQAASAPAQGQGETAAVAEPDEPDRFGMLAGGALLITGYVAAVPWLGFFVSTVIFLAGFAWIGGFRRPILNLLLAGTGAFLMVVLFMRVAYISLPLGEGVFRNLSTGLLALLGVQ